jgi:hypothetical protein
MTATVTEIDIMSLIDWESEMACTAEPCDSEAAWLACPECGCDFALCEECKAELQEALPNWQVVACMVCNRSGQNPNKVLFRRI